MPENIIFIYSHLRDLARQIVTGSLPPDFYRDFSSEYERSTRLFHTAPILDELRVFVAENPEDDFGHGLDHTVKVALDAGVLIIVEGKRNGYPDVFIDRRVFLVQCAGLLHDMKRKLGDHAEKGAVFAENLLKAYPISPDEIGDICSAIRNHEAFKERIPIDTPEGLLVSDCLYDADKFRWGPDNFTDTVWDMVIFSKTPIEEFIAGYYEGMEGLKKIKFTFRTGTGKKYGPQFIDLGLAIGEKLYQDIKLKFGGQS
ncbi:MAG: HD domain-containing protein [Desulfobacterales bacterium]|nr:HD domain-containing protein [Desulfobacterales bacterium]